jgi:thiol-disulfide isomerase/thioredoxin
MTNSAPANEISCRQVPKYFFEHPPAVAGNLFDIVGQAIRTIDQAKGTVGDISNTAQASEGSLPYIKQADGLEWLQDYPRSKLAKTFYNPFDRAVIPLSTPKAGATSTRYQVPIEGKVTMRQYFHEADDSPLLIMRYYDAALAQQGFERVILCNNAPCVPSSGGAYYLKMLDPSRSMDSNYFPGDPLVMIAYKADAIAFVAVGRNVNHPITSFIKLVEGNITDRPALDKWQASLHPSLPPAPVVPAQVVTPAKPYYPPAVSGEQGHGAMADHESHAASAGERTVQAVDPRQFEHMIANQKGIVVVQFTSSDQGCPPCVKSNPRFDTLAQVKGDQAHFWRLEWRPYGAIYDDPLAVQYGIRMVPTFITFKDGKPVRQHAGNNSVVDLDDKLLKGL